MKKKKYITELEWRVLFVKGVRKRLEDLHMTQRTFADLLGVSRPTINNYMVGRTSPPAYIIVRMAEVFGCTTDELINFGKIVEFDNSSMNRFGE